MNQLMKKITLSTLLISMFFMLPNLSNAQSYSFTLLDDGNYDFTLAAVTGFDSGTFAPLVQSYGFTLVVPDGVTITFNTYAPAGTSGTVSPIQGTTLVPFDASMADKDLYLITTDAAGAPFAAHGNGETINLVSFTVNGMPTTGELTVLDNNSTLAMNPALAGSLNSFIQADVLDDAMVDFNDEFIGLTGTSSYNFATLGREEILELSEVSIYPNPTSELLNIKTNARITSVEMYDLLGKTVLQSSTAERIMVNHLPAGVYMLSVKTDQGKLTKKVIIE